MPATVPNRARIAWRFQALNTAANSFIHLRRLPPARSRLDLKKLDAHIEFCQSTLRKATVRFFLC